MNLHIGRNEVVRLFGDNGAGKSTPIKLSSGIDPPTFGEIYVNGEPRTFNSRACSEATGITTIDKDIALVDAMSITRNIFMGRGQKPRHAKTYRDFSAEYARLQQERIAAFGEFAADVQSGAYPERRHVVPIADEKFRAFEAELRR